MHIRGSKSGLVPEAYWTCCRSWTQRNVNLHQVIAFGLARCRILHPAYPAARWSGAHGGQAFIGDSTSYLIELWRNMGLRFSNGPTLFHSRRHDYTSASPSVASIAAIIGCDAQCHL
jgi:hypothetical protein